MGVSVGIGSSIGVGSSVGVIGVSVGVGSTSGGFSAMIVNCYSNGSEALETTTNS